MLVIVLSLIWSSSSAKEPHRQHWTSPKAGHGINTDVGGCCCRQEAGSGKQLSTVTRIVHNLIAPWQLHKKRHATALQDLSLNQEDSELLGIVTRSQKRQKLADKIETP